MFPGCPEHCNAERTLSEYSPNIACRLGHMYIYIYVYIYIYMFVLREIEIGIREQIQLIVD